MYKLRTELSGLKANVYFWVIRSGTENELGNEGRRT